LKLKDQVLYIETEDERFEIVRKEESKSQYEQYEISRIKNPFEKDNDYMRNTSVPLPIEDKQVKV
jgi:hypothetical protein